MSDIRIKKGRTLRVFALVLITIFVFSFEVVDAGVPKILSFQGRLTDASGNLLGGSGTNYYFKFDIYTQASGGSSAWSSGGTAITIKVTQGVFNTLLGDTSAGYGAISLDFDQPAYYLEVRVDDNSDFSSPETLSPRQRIVSAGFAINAETVHGGRFINASGVGQFGGLATVSYSRFGTDTTSHAGTISGANDLLVSGGLEVNGSVAFDGTLTFGGTGSHSAAGEWNFDSNTLVIDSGTDRVGVGALNPARKFNVLGAVSVAQFRLGQSDSVYAEFYVDSSGDIQVSTTGGNIRGNDENLWICSGGACGATAPSGKGNVIVETAIILDNNFQFKVASSNAIIMYDSGGSAMLEFDTKSQ